MRPQLDGLKVIRPLAVLVVLLGFSSHSRGQGFDSKEIRDRVMDATVYIKIKAGPMQGSGSGFVMRATGSDSVLIMTNRHVAIPDLDELPRGTKTELSVVFRSGTAQEQELPAKVLAFGDLYVQDLAVLEVKGVRDLPRAIFPELATKEADVFLTMPAVALGFPLGGRMQEITGNLQANPSVTVNSMSVSALRLDENRTSL